MTEVDTQGCERCGRQVAKVFPADGRSVCATCYESLARRNSSWSGVEVFGAAVVILGVLALVAAVLGLLLS